MTVRKEEGKKEKQEVKEEKDPYFTHQIVEILSAASILYSAHYITSHHARFIRRNISTFSSASCTSSHTPHLAKSAALHSLSALSSTSLPLITSCTMDPCIARRDEQRSKSVSMA